MATDYAPLAAYLAALSPETTSVILTLADIELILGQLLPRAASTRLWWDNTRGRGAPPVWVPVGWQVTFARMRSATPTITVTRRPANGTASPVLP